MIYLSINFWKNRRRSEGRPYPLAEARCSCIESGLRPATPNPPQAAKQAQAGQRQTRRLRNGSRFGIKEVVHHDDIVGRVAERTVGGDGVQRRRSAGPGRSSRRHRQQRPRSSNPGCPRQDVSRKNQRIARIEELHFGQTGHFDIDEDRSESARRGSDRRPRDEERHVGNVAVDRRKQPLRAESLEIVREPEERPVAPPALALTRKPVPGVLNTAPRGELALKKFPGRRLGSATVSGTPSQLISRRRPPKEPFATATLPPPTAARKASRVAVIAAGLAPAAS
jgi:hypothetical protein